MTRGFFELPAQDSTFRGHQVREDLFLVPEMEVKGSRGNADPRGEFSHRKARQALSVEKVSRVRKNLLAHDRPRCNGGRTGQNA